MKKLTIDSNPELVRELETIAYASGDTDNAHLLALVADLLDKVVELEEQVEIAEGDSLAAWERNHGDAQEYYAFFHSCFERLDGHYPAPSVSSDYDCSVVFDAIERGQE